MIYVLLMTDERGIDSIVDVFSDFDKAKKGAIELMKDCGIYGEWTQIFGTPMIYDVWLESYELK